MKKLATVFQTNLYNTRMLIELNFRNLKMFYGLETSLWKTEIAGFCNSKSVSQFCKSIFSTFVSQKKEIVVISWSYYNVFLL